MQRFCRAFRSKTHSLPKPKASFTPTPVSERPMTMMTGPVTIGGRISRRRSGPMQ